MTFVPMTQRSAWQYLAAAVPTTPVSTQLYEDACEARAAYGDHVDACDRCRAAEREAAAGRDDTRRRCRVGQAAYRATATRARQLERVCRREVQATIQQMARDIASDQRRVV